MKRQITFITFSTLVLVAVLALALPGATAVQAASTTSQITIENQNVNSGVVVADSVTAAQNGWVVIYKKPSLNSSDIVGHAWVHQGVNTGVKITVNMPMRLSVGVVGADASGTPLLSYTFTPV